MLGGHIMIIRREQMGAFAGLEGTQFVSRLMDYLRAHFPDATEENPTALHKWTGEQVSKASGHGMDCEQDLAVYVVTAWLLGPEFDTEFPAASAVLGAPGESETKAIWLAEWTTTMFNILEGQSPS